MSQQERAVGKPPSLFRNYVSLVGVAIAIASLTSVVLLFLLEITAANPNPYAGILTYIVFGGADFRSVGDCPSSKSLRDVAPGGGFSSFS